MFFYTPEEVRRIEKNETENGLSSLEMIENAAAALYDRFKECFEANRKPMRFSLLCFPVFTERISVNMPSFFKSFAKA